MKTLFSITMLLFMIISWLLKNIFLKRVRYNNKMMIYSNKFKILSKKLQDSRKEIVKLQIK